MANIWTYSELTKPQQGKFYIDLLAKPVPVSASVQLRTDSSDVASKHTFNLQPSIAQTFTYKLPQLNLAYSVATADGACSFTAEHVPHTHKALSLTAALEGTLGSVDSFAASLALAYSCPSQSFRVVLRPGPVLGFSAVYPLTPEFGLLGRGKVNLLAEEVQHWTVGGWYANKAFRLVCKYNHQQCLDVSTHYETGRLQTALGVQHVPGQDVVAVGCKYAAAPHVTLRMTAESSGQVAGVAKCQILAQASVSVGGQYDWARRQSQFGARLKLG